jgi:hypothetical protein
MRGRTTRERDGGGVAAIRSSGAFRDSATPGNQRNSECRIRKTNNVKRTTRVHARAPLSSLVSRLRDGHSGPVPSRRSLDSHLCLSSVSSVSSVSSGSPVHAGDWVESVESVEQSMRVVGRHEPPTRRHRAVARAVAPRAVAPPAPGRKEEGKKKERNTTPTTRSKSWILETGRTPFPPYNTQPASLQRRP